MKGFNNQQAGSVVWLIVGICIILNILFSYRLGSFNSPGAGFMPFLAGLAMCFFAFAALVQATLRQKRGAGWEAVLKGSMWRRSLVVFVALVLYALLLSHLGFVVCTFLFLLVSFRSIKPMKWVWIVPGSILSTLAFYGIFELWLRGNFPKGPWGF
jgi:putative tricarboxylic transport membrane protein